jgi:hypothetical protein
VSHLQLVIFDGLSDAISLKYCQTPSDYCSTCKCAAAYIVVQRSIHGMQSHSTSECMCLKLAGSILNIDSVVYMSPFTDTVLMFGLFRAAWEKSILPANHSSL